MKSHSVCITVTFDQVKSELKKNIKNFIRMILVFLVLITGRVWSGVCDEENNRISEMPM